MVLGVTGWPGCVTAVAASHLKLENTYGIPCAPISTMQFQSVAWSHSLSAFLPFVYTPHPVIAMPPEALDADIVGNDPDTGRPVIDEIIDVLTRNGNHHRPGTVAPIPTTADSAQTIIAPDTEDNLQRIFYERG